MYHARFRTHNLFAKPQRGDYTLTMKTENTVKKPQPVEIAPGIFWVGTRFDDDSIDCNPYLVIDGDEAVLIDPGSIVDFPSVREAVFSLIPPENISLIIAHHQDPDICGSIAEFYQAGVTAPVAMHWRTSVLVRYYGIQNETYLVLENGWQWSFSGGRTLRFLPAPYCHCPGCIMTYDPESGVLFSSDLFGSLDSSKELYAGADYLEKMKSFHAHYMPSHEILSPVMRSLMPLDISVIAPQHGQIIRENIPEHIRVLESLECGTFAVKSDTPFAQNSFLYSDKSADNEEFRKEIVRLQRESAPDSACLYFSLDNLESVNRTYSRKAGDEMIHALEYIVDNTISGEAGWRRYTLDSPYIACIAEKTTPDKVRQLVEKIRHIAGTTEFTIEPPILSTAVVYLQELLHVPDSSVVHEAEQTLGARLAHAKQNPAGGFCDSLEEQTALRYMQKNILLVEPDDSYVRFLEPFFIERGYRLTAIPDGTTVEDLITTHPPDLVIAEAMAPQINGFEVHDILRMNGKTATVPFILISRRKDEIWLQMAVDKGIVHFLKKPFYKTELLGLVDNLLRTHT